MRFMPFPRAFTKKLTSRRLWFELCQFTFPHQNQLHYPHINNNNIWKVKKKIKMRILWGNFIVGKCKSLIPILLWEFCFNNYIGKVECVISRMVIVKEIKIGLLSSNSSQGCCMCFSTNILGKDMKTFLLSPAKG